VSSRRGGRFLLAGSALGGFLGTLPAPAMAVAIATTTFRVSATVEATCTISALDLPFFDIGSQIDAAAMVKVTCTYPTPWNIGLDRRDVITATISF
jgi:spore coat protein U-like protein